MCLANQRKSRILGMIDKVIQIATGETGPELTCEYETDARYVYPKKVDLIIEGLEEIQKMVIEW